MAGVLLRGLLLAAVLAGATAANGYHRLGSRHGHVCATTCTDIGSYLRGDRNHISESHMHPHFRPRLTYRYVYTGEAITSAMVVNSMESRLYVRTYVDIMADTPCDMKIKIGGLDFPTAQPEDAQEIKTAFEAHDLHFSFQDGRINEVCPHPQEDPRALNFKRAILSSLQTTLSRKVFRSSVSYSTKVLETDALGQCRTRYIVKTSGEDGLLTVNKTKEECRGEGLFPSIPHSTYSAEFERSHHSPVMNFTEFEVPLYSQDQHCQMKLKKGIWQSVDCYQTVNIKPWGPISSDRQATLKLYSNLQLQSTIPAEQQEWNFVQDKEWREHRGLQMDLEKINTHNKERDTTQKDISMTLSDLFAAMKGGSDMEADRPHKFTQLVDQLGRLKGIDNLEQLWKEYENKKYYREFLLDALILCETKECFDLTSRLAGSKMPSHKVYMWLSGLHFSKKPDVEGISSVMSLTKSTEYHDKALMAASSLVYRLCHQQGKCTLPGQKEFRPHKKFLEYVDKVLGDDCGYKETQRHEKVILALKALGNSGISLEGSKLGKCYMNKMHNRDIRVAALMSFRRHRGCNRDDKNLWRLLEDRMEDEAVRIESYKILQKCAYKYEDFFGRVKGLLLDEEVNQVGSYIWTNVRNLAKSSSAEISELSMLANHHYLVRKFQTNAFKHSSNYQSSFHSDKFNLGGSMNSDVVFTPDSFLPYYANFNLTLNVLHNSFNPIEIGGNFHGFEKYIKRLFGKGSFLEDDRIIGFLENLKRQKRSVENNKIDEFQHLYDEAKIHEKESEPSEDQDPTIFVRIFGNEVIHLDPRSPTKMMQQLYHLRDPKSVQLFDQEYVATTILGFPLRMQFNSTVSITLHEEFINIQTENGDERHVRIIPSASLILDQSLKVDAYVASSAMRNTMTTFARMEFGGSLSRNKIDGNVFKFDLPNNEIAKVSSSSKLLFYDSSRKSWDEYRSIPSNEMSSCSGHFTRQSLGVELCASAYSGPSGYTSLEPYTAELVLSKTDTFDHYLIKGDIINSYGKLKVDTPGSGVNRKYEIEIDLRNWSESEILLTFGGKSYGLRGGIVAKKNDYKFNFKYFEEDHPQVEMMAKLKIDDKGNRGLNASVGASITLRGQTYSIDNSFSITSAKMNYSGEIKGFSKEPYRIGVFLESDFHQSCTGNAYVEFNDVRLEGRGQFLSSDDTFDVKVAANYKHGDTNRENLLKVSGSRTIEDDVDNWKGDFFLKSPFLANVKAEYEMKVRPDELDLQSNLLSDRRKMSLRGLWRNVRREDLTDVHLLLETNFTEVGLSNRVQFVYKISPTAAHLEAEYKIRDTLVMKASAMYSYQESPLHFQAGLHLQCQEAVLRLFSELDLSQQDRFDVVFEAQIGNSSTGFVVSVKYPENEEWNLDFNAHIRVERKSEISFYTRRRLSASQEEYSSVNELVWGNFASTWYENVSWTENKTEMSLKSEHINIKFGYEKSPLMNVYLAFFYPDDDVRFKVGVTQTEPGFAYKFSLYDEEDIFPEVTAHIKFGSDSFRGSLSLGSKSELIIEGNFTRKNRDDVEAQATVIVRAPSENAYSGHLALNHTYDGKTRDVKVSGTYEGQQTMLQITVLNHDGWFSNDNRGLTIELTTPLESLSTAKFDFMNLAHSKHVDYLELQVNEIKFRGEAKLSDINDMELSISYDNGADCDPELNFFSKWEDRTLKTWGSLRLDPSVDSLWAFNFTGSNGLGGFFEDTLQFDLDLTSPLTASPFSINGDYRATRSSFTSSGHIGASEMISFEVSGNRTYTWSDKRAFLELSLDLPYDKSISLSTDIFASESNLTVESTFQSFFTDFEKVILSGNSTYTEWTKLAWDFSIKLPKHEANSKLNFTLDDDLFTLELEAMLDSFSVTFTSEGTWNPTVPSVSTDATFNFKNGVNHTSQLAFNLNKEEDKYETSVSFLLQGDEHLRINCTIQPEDITNWETNMEISVPVLSLNTFKVEAAVKGSADHFDGFFSFSPLWEDKFKQSFTFENDGEHLRIETSSNIGPEELFLLSSNFKNSKNIKDVDVKLDIDVHTLSHIHMSWNHEFSSNQHIQAEAGYGNSIANLAYSSLFSEKGDFKSFETTLEAPTGIDTNVYISTRGNANYTGKFEFKWDEYNVVLTTDHADGLIGNIVLTTPFSNHSAILRYSNENDGYNFILDVQEYQSPILMINMNVSSVFPVFDINIDSNFLEKNIKLKAVCDLSQLGRNVISFESKLTSDFETFKEIELSFRGGFTYEVEDNLTVSLNLMGRFFMNGVDSELNVNLNVEASENRDDINFNAQMFCMAEYLELEKQGIDVKLDFKADNYTVIEATYKDGHHNPSFNLDLKLDHFDFEAKLVTIHGTVYKGSVDSDKINAYQINVSRTPVDGSEPAKASLEIKWVVGKVMQIILKGHSDFGPITNIHGKIKGNPSKQITTSIKFVDKYEESFSVVIKYDPTKEDFSSGALVIRIKNTIGIKFQGSMNMNYVVEKDYFESNMVIATSKTPNIFKYKISYEYYSNMSIFINNPVFDFEFNLNLIKGIAFNLNLNGTGVNLFVDGKMDSLFSTFEATVNLDFGDPDRNKNYVFRISYDLTEDIKKFEATLQGNERTFFATQASGEFSANKFDIQTETEIFRIGSYGIAASYNKSPTSFNLQIRDPRRGRSLFSLEFSMTSSSLLLKGIFLESQYFSTKVDYDFGTKALVLDLNSVIYFPELLFEVTADVDFTLENDKGNLNMSLVTSIGGYESSSIVAMYDFTSDESKVFSYVISSGSSSSTINVKIITMPDKFDAVLDLEFTIREYSKLHFQIIIEDHDFKITLITHKHEIIFTGSYMLNKEEFRGTAKLKTSFEEYDELSFSLNVKRPGNSNKYYGEVVFATRDKRYELEISHTNHPTWMALDSKVKILLPQINSIPIEFHMVYDFVEKYLFGLFFSYNDKRLGGELEYNSDGDYYTHNISMILDLTYLDEGKINFSGNFQTKKLKLNKPFYFHISRQQHPTSVFSADLKFESFFESGEIKVITKTLGKSTYKTISDFAYNLQDDRSVNFTGKHNKHNFEGKVLLKGQNNPWCSMAAFITSNIKGYESVDGRWNFEEKDKGYAMEVVLDVQSKKKFELMGSLNYQPDDTIEPWSSSTFEVSFSSAFTKDHVLKVDYHIPNYDFQAFYQYGVENFEISMKMSLGEFEGSFLVSGNLPIPYISVINFEVNYDLKDSYKFKSDGKFESTHFMVVIDLSKNMTHFDSEIEFVSPLFTNFFGHLKWNMGECEKMFDLRTMYGLEKKFETAGNFTHSDEFDSGTISFSLVTPLEQLSSFSLVGEYELDIPHSIKVNYNIEINEEIIYTSLDVDNSEGKVEIVLNGYTSFLDNAEGNINGTIGLSQEAGSYSTEWIVTWKQRPLLEFTSAFDGAKVLVALNYEEESILTVEADVQLFSLEINVQWRKNKIFHFMSTLQDEEDAKQFMLNISGSYIYPIMLNVSYKDIYNFEAKLDIADKMYSLEGSVNLSLEKSDFNLTYESSENPYEPIKINVSYDLVDFINGKMTTLKDILFLKLEWGDSISSQFKGMRSENQVAMQMEIKTPFPDLPVLNFGIDVEVMLSDIQDISSSLYVEWEERVMTNVSLRIDPSTVDFVWDLKTSIEPLQEVSLSLNFSPNNIEVNLLQNENKWKLVATYEFTGQSFSTMIVLTTPFEGYTEIKLDGKFETDGSSLSISLNLQQESSKILDFSVEAELWNIQVKLNTPWRPLIDVKVSASLSTESEEIIFSTTVEWEENKFEFACAMQIIYDQIPVEVDLDDAEINPGKLTSTNNEYSTLKLRIESSQEILDKITCEISFSTDFTSFHFEDLLNQGDANTAVIVNFTMPYHDLELNSKTIVKNLGLKLEGDFIIKHSEYALNSSLMYDFVYPIQLRFFLDSPLLQSFKFSFAASFYDGHVLFTSEQDKFHFMYDAKEYGNAKSSLEFRFEGHPVVIMKGNCNVTNSENLDTDVLVTFEMEMYTGAEAEHPDIECNAKAHYLSNSRQLTVEGHITKMQQLLYETYARFSIPYSLEDKIDWKLNFKKEDYLYQFIYEQFVTPESLVNISSKIEAHDRKFDLTVRVDLDKRNSLVVLSFTDPLDLHKLFISWTNEFPIFEISLMAESLYLSEILNVTLTLDNSVDIKLNLTANYGSEHKAKYILHHNQNLWNNEQDLSIESSHFGNLKSKSNLMWPSKYHFEAEFILPNAKHNIDLVFLLPELKMDLAISSPAIPDKKLNASAVLDVAKEWDHSSLQIQAHHGEKDYNIKGQYTWKEGELKGSLAVEQGEKETSKIEVNGLFDTYWDLRVNVSCTDPDYDGSTTSLRLKPSWPFSLNAIVKMPKKIIRLQSSLDLAESEVIFHIDKQGIQIGYSFSKDSGFLHAFSHFTKKYEISMDYSLQDIFSGQIKIKSPFTNFRYLKTELKIPLTFESSGWIQKDMFVKIDHMEKTYEIFAKVHLKKEPFQIEFRFKTPCQDLEHISLLLEYENGSRKAAFAVLEYPGNKFGFEFEKYFVSLGDFAFVASVHVPLEIFEEVVIRYVVREGLYAFETSLGNVSLGIELEISDITIGQKYKLKGKLNENSIVYENDIIFISFDHVFPDDHIHSFDPSYMKISYKTDIDLGRISSSQYREIVYDEYEHAYILWKNNQKDILKVYVGWGEILGLDLAYRYQPDLKMEARAISSHSEKDLMFRVGFRPNVYGFQILDKKMNSGRRVRLDGEVPRRQIGVDGSYAVDKGLFENSAIVEVDHNQYGYRMTYECNDGFLEDEYIADAQIMLKELRPHLKSKLAIGNAKTKFLSEFKMKESQTDPTSLELDYLDNSLFGVGSKDLGITFKHESFKDIKLVADLTEDIFGKVYGNAIFFDENEEDRKYQFNFEWTPKQSRSGVSVSHVVLHLPKSNTAFNATTTMRNTPDNKSIEIDINMDVEESEIPSQVLFRTSYTKVGDTYNVFTSLGSESGLAYELGFRMNSLDKREYLHMFGKDHGLNNTWDLRAGARTDLPHAFIDVDVGEGKNSPYESRSLKIGLVDPRNIGIFMDHWLFGYHRRDFQASLSLESPYLLRFSSTFDPSVRFMKTDNGIFMHYVSPIDKIFYRHNLENRLRDSMYLSKILLNKFYSPVGATLDLILRNYNSMVYNSLEDLFYTASVIWDQNKFFVREIAATFNYIGEWVSGLDTYVYKLYRISSEVCYAIKDTFTELLVMTDDLIKEINRQFNNLMNELEMQCLEVMSYLAELQHQVMTCISEFAQPFLDSFYTWAEEAALGIQIYADGVRKDLQGCWNHLVDFSLDLSKGVAKDLPDRASVMKYFHVHQFNEGITKFARSVEGLVSYCYTMFKHGTENIFYDIQESKIVQFLLQLQDMKIRPPDEWLTVAREEAESMVLQLDVWFARKDRVSMLFLSRFTGLSPSKLADLWMEFRKGMKELQKSVEDVVAFGSIYFDMYPNLPLSNEKIFDLEKGVLFNYVQYLPVSWSSFTQRLQWDFPESLVAVSTPERVQRVYDLTVQGLEMDFSSILTQARPRLPPFEATASIVGQHVTTFDQRHFEFRGICSYLLTRDFKRKSFDIIGRYTDDHGVVRLASLIMKTQGKTMELTVDGKLFIDDGQVELPYRFKNTHEVSTIGTGVHMTYNKNVAVSCWPATKACSVTVDGTFFGQLSGLFGNFNNEPSDDMKGPGGSDAYNVRHLSYLWAVNDQPCYSANYANQIQYESPMPMEDCHRIFLSKESPLHDCFSSVSPVPYFWKCVNDRRIHAYDPGQEKGVCAAAKAYSLQCFTQDIIVPQLHECKHCIASSGKHVRLGQLEKIETTRKDSNQADIVIALESAKCNEGRKMEHFITALIKAMRIKGKTDVRFAFVPFNRDNKPTAATIGDKVFHSADEMKNLVKNIDYKFRASVNGREAAVRLSSDLRWRPDAVRSVVLIACSSCELSNPENFQSVLEEKKVTLHLVSKIKIETIDVLDERNKTMSGRILGFDDTAAYTVKDYSTFVGDEELRMSMKESQDTCVDAALKSHGSVYSAYKWVPKKKVLMKKFLRILATDVSHDMIPAQCQMCRCREHFFSDTNLFCKRCPEEEELIDDDQPELEEEQEPELEEHQALVANIEESFKKTFGAHVDFNKIFTHLRENGEDSSNEYKMR
ncbi:uncharacterized protein LOC143041514 [Oratosquilla oratoria]|uniref:uncharacterized protein LOC143041514 n=1 Tax=Oratosquilla oratoria TaxID=337810 RepID=UPI003F774BE1